MNLARRIAVAIFAVAAVSTLCLAEPVSAQVSPAPAERNDRLVTDENGVDVIARTFVTTVTDISIGVGESSLVMDRVVDASQDLNFRENPFLMFPRSNYAIYFIQNADGTSRISFPTYDVDFAANSVSSVAGEFFDTGVNGIPGFRATDGTEYLFGNDINFTGPIREYNMFAVTKIRMPSGQIIDVTWDNIYDSEQLGEACCVEVQNDVYARISSVSNNYGYQLKFDYLSDDINRFDGTDDLTNGRWSTVYSVRAFNNYFERVPANATGNSSSDNWPFVAYTYGNGSITATRNDGTTHQVTVSTNSGVPAQTLISETARPLIQISFSRYIPGLGQYYLSSIVRDGIRTDYTVPLANTNASSPSIGVAYRATRVGSSDATTYTTDAEYRRIIAIQRPGNLNTSFTYDAMGRLTETVLPEGNRELVSYDSRSNVLERRLVAKPGSGISDIVSSAGYPQSCLNNINCNRPSWTRDALGNQTDYGYDPSTGALLSVTLPAATTGAARGQIRYSYSQRSASYRNDAGVLVNGPPIWMVSQISSCTASSTCAGTAEELRQTYNSFDPNLSPTSVTLSAGNGTLAATTTAEYNRLGSLAWVDGPLAGHEDRISYLFDANGRLRGTVSPDPDGVGPRPRVAERYTYDAASRVTRVERGNLAVLSAEALEGMTPLQSTEMDYDASGRLLRAVQKSNATITSVSQSSYDAYGRVACQALRMNPTTWPSLPSDACTATAVGPDGADRITRYTYDANDRVTLVETGIGTAIASTEVATAYTANGQTAYVTDGQGNRTSYVYDGHDRLVQTLYPGTAVGANNSNAADYEQLTYDGGGRITQRRLRDGQIISLSYDNLGRLVGRDSPGSELDATYIYDLAGRLVSTTQGFTIDFAADALGRLVSETGPQGTVSYQYDAAGRRTRLTYTDGFYVTYDYDVVGNVTAIRENGAASGVGVLASYAYDSLGRRSAVTFGNGTSQSYTFDNADRLTSLSNDLAGTAQDMSVSYSYNPASQIASSTRNNDAYAWNGHYNVDRSSSIDGLNRIIVNGLTNIGYDGRGNLTTSGTTTYTYNANNQLLTAPGGIVGWDAVGRISKVAATGQRVTRFTYDGIALISEHSNGAMLRRYVHGPGTDQPIVWYEGSGTADRRFLLADERGSIVSVTNSSGTVLAINSYDEYGIPAATNIGRFQYTGQTWLPEIGLYHYKARMYSPTLGRFMQTDPIGYADGMNWYAYVGNDPINFVDPLGLDDCAAGGYRNWQPGDICAGLGTRRRGVSIPPQWAWVDIRDQELRESQRNPQRSVTLRRANRPRREAPLCGNGPRIGVGGTYGGTVFLGDRGISLSIEIGTTSVSLERGSQLYVSLNFSGYKGIGAYAGGGGGVVGSYSRGPMRSGLSYDGLNNNGQPVYAAGAAWNAGAEAQVARDGSGGTASAALHGGYGAYVGVGYRKHLTLATPQLGCP